jgi:hypothetical protein
MAEAEKGIKMHTSELEYPDSCCSSSWFGSANKDKEVAYEIPTSELELMRDDDDSFDFGYAAIGPHSSTDEDLGCFPIDYSTEHTHMNSTQWQTLKVCH